MARNRVKWILRLAAALCILFAGAAFAIFASLRVPYASFTKDVFLDIPRGAGTRRIAAMLVEEGVIRAEWQFLALRLLHPRATLQAGEYRFHTPVSPSTVFDRLVRGDIFFSEVTFPEGSNLFDIAGILDRDGYISGKDFRKAASDPTLIRDLDPHAKSLEGFLFPATYRITKTTTAAQLVKDMTDRFRRAWKSLQTSRDVHHTVTLASLVEKETGAGNERPMVASVYYNRLERSMKLDCDPTTIYAAILEGRYDGVIHRSDLDNNHPYNTYQHAGLPPGPIANPGMKSLEAAANPASTPYLFFVAKADVTGSHVFSTTIEAHNKAVAEYRRGQQKGKPSSPPPPNPRARKALVN